ncbi:MAG: NAD(P)H-dependent oxidoreductase [Bdellovibrionales bacterium]
MKKALIINAHHHYPFALGKLNAALAGKIEAFLLGKGYEVKSTIVDSGYDIEEEIQKHLWADLLILQSPVNWMNTSWTMKKYMDEVYTSAMGQGIFCEGDGRHSAHPKENYGEGGKLKDKNYMLSLTLNAPQEAFDNPDEYLFQGKGLDDLFLPLHATYRFFGMSPLPTFACYDVTKNPAVENDFKRLEMHLEKVCALLSSGLG